MVDAVGQSWPRGSPPLCNRKLGGNQLPEPRLCCSGSGGCSLPAVGRSLRVCGNDAHVLARSRLLGVGSNRAAGLRRVCMSRGLVPRWPAVGVAPSAWWSCWGPAWPLGRVVPYPSPQCCTCRARQFVMAVAHPAALQALSSLWSPGLWGTAFRERTAGREPTASASARPRRSVCTFSWAGWGSRLGVQVAKKCAVLCHNSPGHRLVVASCMRICICICTAMDLGLQVALL